MSKKSRFRGPFKKQNGKRSQSLLKSGSQHLCHICWSLPRQLSWEKSLLLTCKFLELLFNTLAAHEKYHVLNRDNLTIPILIQLSKQQKTFSQFFLAVLKSSLSLKHFEKKDDPQRFWIYDITDSENVVRKMPKRFCFSGPFDKQHGKRAKALLKSAS